MNAFGFYVKEQVVNILVNSHTPANGTLGLDYTLELNAMSSNDENFAGHNTGMNVLDNTPVLGFTLIPHATLPNQYYVTMMSVDGVPLYAQMWYQHPPQPSYGWFSKDADRKTQDWRAHGIGADMPNYDAYSTLEIIDLGLITTTNLINDSIITSGVNYITPQTE